MTRVDKEEKEILDAYENGKVTSVRNKSREIRKHQEYAEMTFKKDKRINIRISTRDLNRLQRRAVSEGIPYQTLVSSVLHKYVDGKLKDT